MNKPKTHISNKAFLLLLLSALLSSCDNSKTQNETKAPYTEAPVISAKKSASMPVAEKAAKPTTENPSQNTNDSPTAEDIANLTRAMSGGATGIMPEDAPRDKHNQRYIIGNLGGVPVNLSPTIAMFVEYEDSPGFNREALRNFKPSVRNYDSVITSFGFKFRLRDGLLLDEGDSAIKQAYKRDLKENDDWVKVSISALREGANPNFLDDYVEDSFQRNELNPDNPIYQYWEPTGETYYGLTVFIHPGIDAKTGKPWREHESAKDQFVFRSADGRVQTMIRCGNKNVVNHCEQHFNFPEPIKIRIRLHYRRNLLPQWQTIEKVAIQSVLSFRTTSTNGESK